MPNDTKAWEEYVKSREEKIAERLKEAAKPKEAVKPEEGYLQMPQRPYGQLTT